MDLRPKDLIAVPLAAMRLAEGGILFSSTVAGNTEISAPVSTRKERPDNPSHTDREPTLESMEEI